MASIYEIVLSVLPLFCIFCVNVAFSSELVIEYSEDKKPCTYFESVRYAGDQHGLVNCTWYSRLSCCKRTEVTSVFGSNMLPLNRATQECQNHINYMMCYFCSPDQYRWYRDGKVHVCETFCQSTHAACQDAFFKSTRLGKIYKNGTSLCEAQNFKVVNSKNCFKYDPTVFDSAVDFQASLTLCGSILLLIQTLLRIDY